MGAACLEFRGENFRGWLKNRKIRESFFPRKFPAIQYVFFCGGEHHSLHSVQAHQRLSWPGQAMCSNRKLKNYDSNYPYKSCLYTFHPPMPISSFNIV